MTECKNIKSHKFSKIKSIMSTKKIGRLNTECAFDIETTSTYINGSKMAFMYIWMLGIDGVVYYGRDLAELIETLSEISSRLDVNIDNRLVIYVHNLQFEFQFIYKLFEWEKVFSLKPHKPIYAITKDGIEFRCSYLLSGLKLERVAKNLRSHKVEKLDGNLDYNKVRHHKTSLTESEMAYCKNDILVLLAYINEQLNEHQNNINNIPMTNTGRVRNFCRRETLGKNYKDYSAFIRKLTLDLNEYEQMKRAFQGGFTHANYRYVGDIVCNVTSFDLASSYPSTMVCDLYPMSKPRLIEIENDNHFYTLLNNYCCVFDAEFTKICENDSPDNIISESRCWKLKGGVINNGRVAYADVLGTTLTELDYESIEQFYDWETVTISNMRIMEKKYLPKSFIMSILKLYSDKTTLKDVAGKEAEYMRSKNMINSAYGMTVTDIARPEIIFQSTGEWLSEKPDMEKSLRKYNMSKRRFLYYPWGVWVTAYARRNLFSAILEFGGDYIYSDTDSVKVINAEKHEIFINSYNENIRHKMYKMCEAYNIDKSLVEPLTPKGEKKLLGVWENEGTYEKFKTLGAKRYMVEKNGEINITVAGVNKLYAVPYLVKNFPNAFDAFEDSLIIPPEHTGKLTHTYIDDEIVAMITDYQGNTEAVRSLSSVHLEKAPYEMSLSRVFINFLTGAVEYKE